MVIEKGHQKILNIILGIVDCLRQLASCEKNWPGDSKNGSIIWFNLNRSTLETVLDFLVKFSYHDPKQLKNFMETNFVVSLFFIPANNSYKDSFLVKIFILKNILQICFLHLTDISNAPFPKILPQMMLWWWQGLFYLTDLILFLTFQWLSSMNKYLLFCLLGITIAGKFCSLYKKPISNLFLKF